MNPTYLMFVWRAGQLAEQHVYTGFLPDVECQRLRLHYQASAPDMTVTYQRCTVTLH